MLIEKKPGEGDLIAIKLITGEEIVGRIAPNPAGSNENDLTLKSPVGWMLTQQGVMPAPIMVTAEDKATLTFVGSAIMCRTKPREEIGNAYITITTGIQVPSSPLNGGFVKG